ncbi:MAG: hypothetical protein V1768_00455 [Patescibacteria group bacterium]|nr:hypothetical protein [Patescibacteria group bacterium]MBU1349929.1 hypothetical protein [Patescibacteria group bacterium]MBU1684557.1 hypothetical protein [Patescibacteria group bacterium]MBU1778383.1 hypothetical protein [Patescibacteria group bacterium]MBU1987669.1 hypothetical protein [Patescibacteria group bacterium]
MTKKEIIWREILHQAIQNKKTQFTTLDSKNLMWFTQKGLAEKFGFSLSTVFNALKVPRSTGAIDVKGRGFIIRDKEKFLQIWATFRNLEKDIIYKTHSNFSSAEIEGSMPPKIIYGAFSAFVKKFKQTPADYDKVYIYADQKELKEIQKRFPKKNGYENLIVLKKDSYLSQYGQITPIVQTFVDLWNLQEWYAKEFLNALKEKIFNYAILS